MKIAFGDSLPEAGAQQIARKVLRFFAKNWLELFFYAGSNKPELRERITVAGHGALDQALAKGKGVIAVSGHIGNYGLLGTQFTERGYDFTVVIREPKNPALTIYENGRAMMGLRRFPQPPSADFSKAP